MFKKNLYLIFSAFLVCLIVIACNQNNSFTDKNSNFTFSENIPIGVAVAQTSNVALLGRVSARKI